MPRLIMLFVTLALAGCVSANGPDRSGAASSAAQDGAKQMQALSPEEQARIQKAGAQILFWSDEQRSANFRNMEAHFPGTSARHGKVRSLAKGKPLAITDAEIRSIMDEQHIAGLMVLQNGKIRYEGYNMDFGPEQRWTSFSVAKSFTSTLAGAALKDGYIKSLDDPVTRYIPEMKGSAYDGVSVRQVLTMTSGVKWNEDYTDPNSDVVRNLSEPLRPGEDPNISYLSRLPRVAEPGTKWAYKTGETNLLGAIVARATGRQLSDYAEEKIARPAGFAGDMFWMVDTTGQNIGGCCLSLRLSDYARMGLFALEGGHGQVPDGWFAEAGSEQASIGKPGFGYGYQWWTYPGGAFGAQGIFGQAIIIVPQKQAVIAIVSNWPVASNRKYRDAQIALVMQMIQRLDE